MRTRALSVALLFATAIPALTAQSFTPVREQKNLSPAALEKLHTLETLNTLPAGDWHIHIGDIPHGESPTLDDASWATAKPGSKAPKGAVWYRRLIEVPKLLNGYDISGSRILFQFEADANGSVPEIIYFNGKRVALGEDLEPIVLFEPAHPGDKILVAVKLLTTIDDKQFTGVNLRIEPILNSTSPRPNPDDIRIQCITAANLLPVLPTPRKDLLPTVESAIAAIDLKALKAGNQDLFDASLTKAQTLLAPLHDILAIDKLDLAGNSHIDAAWLWPRSETIDVVHRTFATALQLMNEYPNYTYTQSAAQYTAWMADKYPDLNAQIKQRVKEGRWEIVGGMWVEPDLNLPGGESLVRQLLVGQRYFKQQYDVTARIGWNPDSFGYNWQLPQIYKRSGLDYFVTQKMHWNDTNQLPFRLFWWQSPDGSKVLTYFPTDYAWTNVNPTRLSADFAESAQRNPGTTEHLDLFGVGDHGGGPTRDMLDQADHWIALSKGSALLGTGFSPSVTNTKAPKASALEAKPALLGTGFSPSVTNTKAPKASALEAKPALLGTGFSPSVANTKGSGALAPEGMLAAVPTIRYSTAQNYFTHVESHLNPISPTWNYDLIAKGYTPPPAAADGAVGLPTWNDELYFEYHRGIFTSQAQHKRYMRTSETQTLNAEKFASLAWLSGTPYPNAVLTNNWKEITFNQFHDLAAGSGIAVIYRDAQKDFYDVFNEDHIITETSLKTLDANINTAAQPGTPVIIYNTLAWPRSELIPLHIELPDTANALTLTDAKGTPIPTQVTSHTAGSNQFDLLANVTTIPALGYTILHAEANKQSLKPDNTILSLASDASSFTLMNANILLNIDKETGCITKIVTDLNYLSSREFLAPQACGNQLQTYADNPKQYDAWNIDPGTLDAKMTPIDKVDSIDVLTDGPLRKTIRIQRTWSKSHFTQDISLDANSDVVNITTDVSWHEQHVLLKAAFPLAATSGKATYEIPFGSIQRPTTRNNSWEKAKFEVPAQNWADLGDDHQGLSLLNDSKYGYDALGNTLRLTLLRSPTWPDPDADQGHQHFTYALYPHTGTWAQALTIHRGLELNTPLTAQQVFSHTGPSPATLSYASVENPNVILTAVKKAEDTSALIFRMYESTGQATDVHLHIPTGATYAIETNLMETPIPDAPHLPVANDLVTIPIKPYEILTVQVLYPNSTDPTLAQ
jgi:alpha-mannosidase